MSEAAATLAGDNGSVGDTGTASTNTGAQNWSDGFDENTVAYIQNKGWANETGVDTTRMVESYRNLEKFAGGSKNLIELPGEDADADVMNNFFNALGRPETPDQYSFKAPDNADPVLDGWFRQTAHELGIPDKQAAALYDKWNEMSTGRIESIETELKQQAEIDIKNLQKEWGKTYDENIGAGRRAASALGYDEQALSSLEEKMGTGEMLKLFANLGSKMGEDSFEDGERSGSSFGSSPAQARQQIADLKLDKAFMDKYLAGDKDATGKMTRLMEAAYG